MLTLRHHMARGWSIFVPGVRSKESAMKRLCVLVAILAVALALEGCRKHEPKPAPQVQTPRPTAAAPAPGRALPLPQDRQDAPGGYGSAPG